MEQLDYICDYCKAEITNMTDLGYLGSKDRQDQSCNPFLDMLCLCKNCEEKRSKNNICYAGIGSRKTPDNILEMMREMAKILAKEGYTLRSGGAEGADSAFEKGCDEVGGKKEIYLPWKNFNGNSSFLYNISEEAFELAKRFHPAWSYLKYGAKCLHSRNGYQILGLDLNTPVGFIICYAKEKGGTDQALRVAASRSIPFVNLAFLEEGATLETVLDKVLRRKENESYIHIDGRSNSGCEKNRPS